MTGPPSGPPPRPDPGLADPTLRLARLRREHAPLYPGLDAGVWYPAGSVAEYFLAWLIRHPGPDAQKHARVLDAQHFEFRGGVPRDAPWVHGRNPDERQA
ncbi:MAG: hypothetical protein H0W29_02440 [Gemmatimonadales bacterium]|nr:hypothetical protein [Gemmatimonadales bacterium]